MSQLRRVLILTGMMLGGEAAIAEQRHHKMEPQTLQVSRCDKAGVYIVFLTLEHLAVISVISFPNPPRNDSGRRMPVRPGQWRLPRQSISPEGAGYDIIATGRNTVPVVLLPRLSSGSPIQPPPGWCGCSSVHSWPAAAGPSPSGTEPLVSAASSSSATRRSRQRASRRTSEPSFLSHRPRRLGHQDQRQAYQPSQARGQQASGRRRVL